MSHAALAPLERLGMDPASIQKTLIHHLHYTFAKDQYTATKRDLFNALAYSVRDHLVERWIITQRSYYDTDAKRVYYLSLEYLMGQSLKNNLINLQIYDECNQALQTLGYSLEELSTIEWDAGLGNGGLGRLAACYLDSMATLGLPGYGYGLRYDYGIFYQKIENGYQVETPDNWLRYGNPWEINRPEYIYPVYYGGRIHQYLDKTGHLQFEWVDREEVIALAYDTPIAGFGNRTVNTMRLWSAKSARGFDLNYFNHGDYIRAVEDRNKTENITRVLYPNDNICEGKELRLKQEYFLVSATLQDIIRRYKKSHHSFDQFKEKVAIQLNDTHPSLAIPELMRILMDHESMTWETAWDITTNTFGYTNHTVLPEALEKWPVTLMEQILPRHLQIIYEINRRFLEEVSKRFPGDNRRLSSMSLIEEGPQKKVRMANLSIVGSHRVNGVSALHTHLLQTHLFKDFNELYKGRFINITNGITPRRWLKLANPSLAKLIDENIGTSWMTHLYELEKLVKLADNSAFREEWMKVKRANKERLARSIRFSHDIVLNIDSLFDCQIKRFHEYKRQLLNVLQVIAFYNHIKANPNKKVVPRTVIFSGKAAPGYYMAKLIIKLINSVADTINHDLAIEDKLKVIFMPNYRVTLAELIIPATDLSEQISTAGYEASGTSNMKFGLNGALTIGTLDGANIEIKDAVGDDNIFIFGLNADEVMKIRQTAYNALDFYNKIPELKQVVDMIKNGAFSPAQPHLFQPIVDSLLGGDHYLLFADFASYLTCQEKVSQAYLDHDAWAKKSILNVARMGIFSSDRSVQDYASKIWGVKPV
jgi:starch phosphorylase